MDYVTRIAALKQQAAKVEQERASIVASLHKVIADAHKVLRALHAPKKRVTKRKTSRRPKGSTKNFSVAARKKISQAQKRRWAKVRTKAKAA